MSTETDTVVMVKDEHGQRWKITPRDAIWEECLHDYQEHGGGEYYPLVPLSKIREHMSWGWWTVYKDQDEFIANLGVPSPTQDVLSVPGDLTPLVLSELLQRFGGYVTYLEAVIGDMTGRRIALKDGLAAAVLVESAELEDDKLTERAKEARIVAGSETLRRTKRMLIEQDAFLAAVKGVRDAYRQAYDTVSRQVSLRDTEARLATGRHA